MSKAFVNKTKLNDVVSVRDFGAKGDGVTDDRAAIQAAINSLNFIRGGTVLLPIGRYKMTASGGRCLLIDRPIIFEGQGAWSVLWPEVSLTGTDDIIHIVPNPATNPAHTVIRDMFIGNPETGSRTGRHGIYVNTQAVGAYLPTPLFERLNMAQGSGRSIFHINNPTNNPNGGMYGATIRDNTLRGGIYLDATGDSVYIYGNVITDLVGVGATVGVYAAMVTGASVLNITNNNITTINGAIEIAQGRRVMIAHNNIEQTSVGGNSGAMINVTGASGTCTQVWVEKNFLGAFTASGITHAIKMANTFNGKIKENTFLPSSGTQFGASIAANCNSVFVGANQFGTGSTNRIDDLGSPNLGGVWKTLSLQNSWVTYNAAFADPRYIKDEQGYVTVEGVIKDGATTNPTILANLPVDYRPAKSIFVSAYSQNSTPTQVLAGMLVTAAAGNLVYQFGANNAYSIDCRFRSSTGFDTVSDL